MQLTLSNINKKPSRKSTASDVITSLAFLVLFVTTYYQLYTKADVKLTQYAYEQTHQSVISVNGPQNTPEGNEVAAPIITAAPVKITIPAIGVHNIPVVPGGIIGDNWLLFDNKAIYLQTSGLLGEGYNTVIYAHKRHDLFQNIKTLNIGDNIHVVGDNEKLYSYSVYEKETVNLKDVSKLKSTEPNIITLFTCDGPLDQERVIVRARMVLE